MKKIAYISDLEKWRSGFQFHIEVSVRFSETDMFGHMNNTVPFVYFEEARIEFMKHLGFFIDNTEKPVAVPVVADLQCDYHQQIYFDDRLKVYVKADHIGNTSYDLHYMAVNQNGDTALTARGRLVQVNPDTGKPVPLSADFKKMMEEKSTACI